MEVLAQNFKCSNSELQGCVDLFIWNLERRRFGMLLLLDWAAQLRGLPP
jgi:hypothetical protein